MKQPIIKTKDFILRPFTMRDASAIAKQANNKKIYRYTLLLPYPYKLADAKKWLTKITKRIKEETPTSVNFAIVINSEAVGAISLNKIILGHKAEIGYWLGEEHWGRGVMSRAIKEVTNYGFKELKLRRIYAPVFIKNIASQKVLKKNGYKIEGIARKTVKKDGKFIDEYILARVR